MCYFSFILNFKVFSSLLIAYQKKLKHPPALPSCQQKNEEEHLKSTIYSKSVINKSNEIYSNQTKNKQLIKAIFQ